MMDQEMLAETSSQDSLNGSSKNIHIYQKAKYTKTPQNSPHIGPRTNLILP